MEGKMIFENGVEVEYTKEEMRLLKLLISKYSDEIAKEHNIDTNAVESLKSLFLEHLD